MSSHNLRMTVVFTKIWSTYCSKRYFSYDQPRVEKEILPLHFPFKKVQTFEYFKNELKKKIWCDFTRHPNPVALALLGKMGYDQSEKARMKYEFLLAELMTSWEKKGFEKELKKDRKAL